MVLALKAGIFFFHAMALLLLSLCVQYGVLEEDQGLDSNPDTFFFCNLY